jgi:hypothetical protein
MKTLLTISCGCVLAAITVGLCQTTASGIEPATPEVAPSASGNQPTPPVLTGNTPAPASSPAAPAPSPTPSENVTINLINRLVQRGVLTKDDADELIKQAQADTVKAREQASAANNAPAEQSPSPNASLFQSDAAAPPADGGPSLAPSTPPSGDTSDEVRVPYVPDIVRKQIADEVREEVMQKARDENWASPRTLPDWTLRLTPFADFLFRYEGQFFPGGNDNSGAFPNFNAINTGSPFDTAGTTFSPQLDVDKNRDRFRIRVRFGAQMDLEDGFTFGIRIATGENNSPTSTNQSLGAANGAQGGDFSKYAIWLDRAFVSYEIGGTPNADFKINVGRTENPFFAPSELVWDNDLGFDGLSVTGHYQISKQVTPFATVGGFPIFNTDLNFSTNRPAKISSEDKYLLAGQTGANLNWGHDLSQKIAIAYYVFENIEGRLSSPFVPLTTSDQGNTDDSRPAFAQKGNTYFPIRDILPTADNDFGTIKQYQYYGLATPFHEIDFSGTVDYARFDPFHLSLFGEYVKNVAFDRATISARAVNNLGPDRADGKPGSFVGGDTGWIIGIKAGTPAFEKRWDWNAGVSYRYLESDATVDGFNDSDFGLGGTNLKGYTLSGAVALSKHVSFNIRWMSANEVAGPTFRNDIFQFDFNAKF